MGDEMLNSIFPQLYFLEFSFKSPKRELPIKIDGDLKDWDKSYLIPDLMHLTGKKPFADVYFSWDYENLFIGANITDKRYAVEVDTIRFWQKDCIEVWIDLRDDKSLRVYNEHCHHFFFLPMGRKENSKLATAGECREPGSTISETYYDHPDIEISSIILEDGYSIEARIPISVIPTYDPINYPKIGFNYHINDTDGRAQWWSCGTDFQRHIDPSTWGTIELIDK